MVRKTNKRGGFNLAKEVAAFVDSTIEKDAELAATLNRLTKSYEKRG